MKSCINIQRERIKIDLFAGLVYLGKNSLEKEKHYDQYRSEYESRNEDRPE